MVIYRLTLSKYVDSAFSGEGPRRVGSRWSPVGYPAVYASSSIALTVLETVAHTDAAVMPSHHVIGVEVPDALTVEVLDNARLPGNWRATPAPKALQSFGKGWLEAGTSAILQVPSAIVPQEANYLVNPLHPEFAELSIGEAEAFVADRRLLARNA